MNILKIPLLVFYLAALAFGVFLTGFFRLPAPILFCIPLIFFWKERKSKFLYGKEVLYFGIAIFLYEVVGMQAFNSFFAKTLAVIICTLYFSYFVHFNVKRFNYSVWIFYSLLLLSAVVMVADHWYPQMDDVRAFVTGTAVLQSPAGIASTQFSYGYQLAAFLPFALISTFVFKRGILIKLIIFITCIAFVFLGMQRSVFVGFAVAMVLFLLLYHGFKSLLLLGAMVAVCVLFFNMAGRDNLMTTDNILNKNEHNDEASNRSDLARENMRIYTAYPYGLIFYGKDWQDVIYRNYVFSAGITSHNAYLMFITYLGPFLGIGLLAAVYVPAGKIIWTACRQIHAPNQAVLICLVFSFISVSVNALSHNAWLFGADGPTIFSFFSLVHGYKLQQHNLEITSANPQVHEV